MRTTKRDDEVGRTANNKALDAESRIASFLKSALIGRDPVNATVMPMIEAERIDRLTTVLQGTGATVNDAFGIWALDSELSDNHISELADWADLQYLIADSTHITDASLASICCFHRLTDLSIGGNAISSAALADCDLPTEIENLGLGGISLTNHAVSSVCQCSRISALNVNYCNLSRNALAALARLPRLRTIEALGADSTAETGRTLSARHPNVLFRLRDGLWQNGECRRLPFPNETA